MTQVNKRDWARNIYKYIASGEYEIFSGGKLEFVVTISYPKDVVTRKSVVTTKTVVKKEERVEELKPHLERTKIKLEELGKPNIQKMNIPVFGQFKQSVYTGGEDD